MRFHLKSLNCLILLFSTLATSIDADAGLFDFLKRSKAKKEEENHVIPRAIPVDESEEAPASTQSYGRVVNKTLEYRIVKEEWSPSDEEEFGNFITSLADSKCNTFMSCIKGKGNPYRSSDPPELYGLPDCADFPQMLRAYFAWKKGLPFSIASLVGPAHASRERDPSNIDIRYTKYGNIVHSRRSFTYDSTAELKPNINDIFSAISAQVHSGSYRINQAAESDTKFSDVYPVKLNRQEVRPGTVLYNTNGHVAIVSRVLPNGQVQFIQAGISNGHVSSGSFNGNEFPFSDSGRSGGFKNWRPQKLINATRNSEGFFEGGSIIGKSNQQLTNSNQYSQEQYAHQGGKFYSDGAQFSWEDFVQSRLAENGYKVDPLDRIKTALKSICEKAKSRSQSLFGGFTAQMNLVPHPETYPSNIFGPKFGPDFARWEEYSSPGRDADLRAMILDLRSKIISFSKMNSRDLKQTTYEGSNIKEDIKALVQSESNLCTVEYSNSQSKTVALSLLEVMKRAPHFSFDPYHCPERRWGASGLELSSCVEHPENFKWYEASKGLRSITTRDTSANHLLTLEEVKSQYSKLLSDPKDYDLMNLLD